MAIEMTFPCEQCNELCDLFYVVDAYEAFYACVVCKKAYIDLETFGDYTKNIKKEKDDVMEDLVKKVEEGAELKVKFIDEEDL